MQVAEKVAVGIAAALLSSVDAQTCGIKGTSSSQVNPLIVGGEDADECEWKWQVGLRSSSGNGKPWCGGMLIDPEWVLTAAHCIDGSAVNVIAGDWDVTVDNGNQQERWSSAVFPHPEYNSANMDKDYALIKLASPMDMTQCVGTVCLPTEGNDVAPGSKCWITGWGTLQSGGSQPTILQEAEVEVLSNTECKATDYDDSAILPSMLCAAGKNANGDNTDACQGDSGGPLVCEAAGVWSLYGATSWGRGCAWDGYPGIWARVHNELAWIKDVMAGGGPPPVACPEWCGGRYCWFEGCKPCC